MDGSTRVPRLRSRRGLRWLLRSALISGLIAAVVGLSSTAYAATRGFGFTIASVGWTTYSTAYHAGGSSISVHFDRKQGHDVTVKLTSCPTPGRDLTGDTYFSAPDYGPHSVGRLAAGTCFHLTMNSSTVHTVQVAGTVSGVR
jgi:hypothetical protein